MATLRSVMLASAVASAALAVEHAYADGAPFNFSPFNSYTSQEAPPAQASAPDRPAADVPPAEVPRVRNDNPRTTASGFDPEALERGAKALREINSSPQAKKVACRDQVRRFFVVFELMRKQEETRQVELAAKKAEFQAIQAQHETLFVKSGVVAEHESQRARNQELVKMQEESSIRQEQIRRATEEQIQAQRRQTEREKAELERETIRVRALAEAEGRAHEAKLAEDVNRRMLIERANAEREKWISAINTTFDHIGGGLRAILTDQNKLVIAVGGVTAVAAGVYTTR
ncbi:hypothetical protein BHE74_00037605 [Ensete ventricosum]|nr:hypothetical protein BHE74_00037605 [Ensete ventricosum]